MTIADAFAPAPPSQNGHTKALVIPTELGHTGLKQSWGLVTEEFLLQLQGDRAVRVYREMGDNDPTVGAVLYALENIVRQVTWQAQGTNAKLLDSMRDDMEHSWEDFIAEALSKLQYGWAYHEIVYKERPDGKIGWAKLPIRAQETLRKWEFGPHGEILGMWQCGAGFRDTFIPTERALHFRTSVRKNNPEGRSVLRSAYRPWWFKKRIEEHEAVGIERDLAGIPKIGVPAELLVAAPGSEAATALAGFKEMGTNLRNDEQACIIYPLAYDESGNKLYEIELMASGGRRQFVTGDVIARKSVEIASSCLADVILMGHESVGSFALSASKERLLVMGVQSQVDEIAAQFNEHAIPALWRLNGMDPTNCPKLVPGQLQSTDVKDLAEVIWKLSMAGMAFFPSPDMENALRALLDLPAAEGTELTVNVNTGARGTPENASHEDAPAPPVAKAINWTPPEVHVHVDNRRLGGEIKRDEDGLMKSVVAE